MAPRAGGAGRYTAWAHEDTYRGLSPVAFLHRARLATVRHALAGLELPDAGRVADFGCSNGFVLERVRAAGLVGPRWRLVGLDSEEPLLEQARRKGIPGAEFHRVDLNGRSARWDAGFDLVLCLETLEHTGDYRAALRNVGRSCRPGGHVLVTVPDEVGLRGLLKFFGRMLVERDPYGGFFAGRSRWPYLRALLRGEDLERFRAPPRTAWGAHLGFDIRRFESALESELLGDGAGRFELLRRARAGLGLGRLYLLRRRE